jgi:hypothetical protein
MENSERVIKLEPMSNGIRVIHSKFGTAVDIKRAPNGYEIYDETVSRYKYGIGLVYQSQFDFINMNGLVHAISRIISEAWEAREGHYRQQSMIKEWQKTQTAKAIASSLKGWYHEERKRADPTILNIQMSAYRSLGPNAAMVWTPLDLDMPDREKEMIIRDYIRYPFFVKWSQGSHSIESLLDWRNLSAYNGKAYKAHNLSIDNWPGGLPSHTTGWLSQVKLDEPVTKRLQAIAIAALLSNHAGNSMPTHLLTNVDHIRKAIAIHDRYNHVSTNIRKYGECLGALTWVFDVPFREKETRHIHKLAEDSRDYHQDLRQQDLLADEIAIKRRLQKIALWTNTPYDEDVHLPQLDSMPIRKGVIIEPIAVNSRLQVEQLNMGHCVGTYLSKCLSGRSFIFHVEHEDEQATIEVDAEGHVMQVHGPRNQDNRLCKSMKMLFTNYYIHHTPTVIPAIGGLSPEEFEIAERELRRIENQQNRDQGYREQYELVLQALGPDPVEEDIPF